MAVETAVRNLAVVLGIAGFYVWWAQTYHPLDSGGHDMPLQNALGSLGQQRVFGGLGLSHSILRTRFYSVGASSLVCAIGSGSCCRIVCAAHERSRWTRR